MTGTQWPLLEALSASCQTIPDPPHPRPCRCGIHGLARGNDLTRAIGDHGGGHTFLVIGKVALWGRVIPGERGWRAELAYPQMLWFIDKPWLDRHQRSAITRSLDAYGVETEAMSWHQMKRMLSPG